MRTTYIKFRDLMLVTICFFSVFLLTGQATAFAEEKVVVSLPDFPVKLNGMEIDNRYNQYPLLIYNNITYFPMTYYGSRYLGVETTWSHGSGLGVYQNGVRWNWHGYKRYLPNGKTGVATIHNGVIRVNDTIIDNSQEDYPLLSFRDVAYFPLTWRFAVEEFGWTYQYNPQDGLTVYSPGAVTANEITLPIKEYDDGAGAFVKVGDYYYFEGERGIIWQASVAQPNRTKKVYQLPLQKQQNLIGQEFCRPGLKVEHGMILLVYQQQDEMKTVSHYIQLMEDGTAQELYQGAGILHSFGESVVLIEPDARTGKYVLKIRDRQNGAFKKIGTEDFYCSGSNISFTGTEFLITGGFGKSSVRSVAERKILAVNTKTGVIRKLNQEEVSFFTVEEEQIYFLNTAGQLYRLPLAGGKATLISAIPATQFVVRDATVCYTNRQNGELKVLGSTENLNPGGIVESMEVQEDFFVINFSNESQSAYRTMILSRKGKVLFKTTERTASMIIENGIVSFVKLRSL